jgi:hypothetical protein
LTMNSSGQQQLRHCICIKLLHFLIKCRKTDNYIFNKFV